MIQSNLIPNAVDGIQYLIYDTVLNGKHVFTACGVGIIEDNDANLTPTGRATLFSLTEYVNNFNSGEFTIRLQEIATTSKVKVKIRKAIEVANNEEVIFFVCRSHKIYDAAVAALQVRWVVPDTKH
jgi:hypothetical protein